jgi:type IV pilus assembly protein PilM
MAKKKKIHFKESLGIDIGTHSIKIVHLKKQHNTFRLVNYNIQSTIPEGLEQTPSELSPGRYPQTLSTMLKSMKINPKKMKHVVSSIGGDNTSIKQIRTIFLPDEELSSALFFEAKKHLPISGSEMILDHQVLSVEEKTNNMNILLAAATKSLLNEHTKILSAVELTPGIVDVEALAIANSFSLNNYVEDGVYILINVGAYKTNMVIYGPNAKFFARDIAWGGFHISKDIMKNKKMSFEEAEREKMKNGILDAVEWQEHSSSIALDISEKSTQEQIVSEIKRSLRFYVKEAGNSDFRTIILSGGSAKLKGLAEYIQSHLNIEVKHFNRFENLDLPADMKNEVDPQLAVAIGLAMRPE